MVEGSAGGRDGDIVLVRDRAQASQTTLKYSMGTNTKLQVTGRTWNPLMRPAFLSLVKLSSTAFWDVFCASDAFASSTFCLELDARLRSSSIVERNCCSFAPLLFVSLASAAASRLRSSISVSLAVRWSLSSETCSSAALAAERASSAFWTSMSRSLLAMSRLAWILLI